MRAALAAILTACMLAGPVQANPKPEHEPSGSWRWSLLFPGLGQIALGEPLRGAGFVLGTLTLPVLGFAGTHILLTPDQPPAVQERQFLDDQTLLVTGIGVAVALAAGLWTLSAFDAYHLDLEKSKPMERAPDLPSANPEAPSAP